VRLRARTLSSSLLLVSLLALGCGAEDRANDPRCRSLCESAGKVPATGSYCDQDSIEQCKSLCGQRIQGVSNICGACLLEQAEFHTGVSVSNGPTCTMSMCTITNDKGQSCSYSIGDDEARKKCNRDLYPPTAITCDAPEFRPVTECGSVCGG
jgi:hypothetical protein